MNANLIIFGIIIIFSCIAYRKFRQGGITMSVILYILYLLSFVSTYIMGLIMPGYTSNVLFIPTLYLILILPLWFNGFSFDYHIKIDCIQTKTLARIMTLIMLPVFLYYLYYLLKLYNSGLFVVADNIRDELSENNILPGSTLNSIFTLISQLYFINIFLFYIGLSNKWPRGLVIALIVTSFSFPLQCLCYLGRDGLVLWIFNTIILFVVLRKYLSEKIRKRIFLLLLSLVAIGLIIVVSISLYRFFGRVGFSDAYIWQGTLGYYGQQIGNFSDMFYGDYDYVNTLFPGFRSTLYNYWGIDVPSYREMQIKNGMYDEIGVFSFFTSTLVSGYGYLGGFILSIFFFLLCKKISVRSKRIKSNYYFLCSLILFQIPMNGVFYYRLSISRGDIAYAIGFLILYWVYQLKRSI